MDFTLDSSNSLYQIRAYSPGQLTLNERLLTHSVIITPKQLIHPWAPQYYVDLEKADFIPLEALQPKIILLGTGEKSMLPDPALLESLYHQGIGVEVMSTAAACRTFNVLAAEERNVAAALIIH